MWLVLLATAPVPFRWKWCKFNSEPCSPTAFKLLLHVDLIMQQSRDMPKLSQMLGLQQMCHCTPPSDSWETPLPGREGRKLSCSNFDKRENYYNPLHMFWPEKKEGQRNMYILCCNMTTKSAANDLAKMLKILVSIFPTVSRQEK